MRDSFPRSLLLLLSPALLLLLAPPQLPAQLGREGAPPPAVQAPPQTPPDTSAGKRRVAQEMQITGDQHWVNTGIDVQAGEHALLTASGNLRYSDAPGENGPEGRPRSWKDLLRILPFNEAGRGALLARIGDADAAQPFLVGARREFTARFTGRLFLGINQAGEDAADGTYRIRVEIYVPEGGAARAAAPALRDVAQIPGVDANLFSKIPRHISDKEGNPGDMVNFLILGSEAPMQRAFELAGWVKVDRTSKDAVLHGIIASISKESYVHMPMSELYLFGRYQDYGYAHAEPLTVVAQRHHLRLWKTPFQANGQPVWAGAATHDIGFDLDKRNNGITHKIDPNIDEERDYVGKTLGETGLIAQRSYFLPANQGIPKLIEDGTNGLLAEAGDQNGFTRGLFELVTNSSRRAALALAGRHTIESRYSFATRMKKLSASYDELLGR